ncbi:type-F conjugative transfer system pilin assembly thiol-disulfide isomerase TrbB [Salmonella enterica]|uniref:type-F conjugative transfer system pilin assembly thiol-disulfide isomerase TrbB n=1 Tax=Salmonella enterica TaxID=28901 RepID=UPI0020CAD794|nr:type-F conjugative transfer system pilin assembly thiol-disulfide isomerase TrbB [Salmonella enterica]
MKWRYSLRWRLPRTPCPGPQELVSEVVEAGKPAPESVKVVLFMQSTCQYCRQFAPVLKAFSQQTGLDVFPISLDGKGDAEFPDVLPATPDVMVEYFQSGLPVATPTTFLTNVNTMETWPLLQGAAETGEFRSRLDEVLRMALDRQSEKSIPLNAQGQK